MTTQRVVLHVGTPKSATTYLQDLLWASRDALLEAGVLFPGNGPVDHFHAALELGYGGNFHGQVAPETHGAWSRLVEAARSHSGTTVISHELFGDLSADTVAQALRDLDFAEVHVVMTARDLGRQIPSVWQEEIKNGHHLPFADFLEVIRPGSRRPDVLRPGPGRPDGYRETFWLRQDVPAVLRRWSTGLPASRVHLITVPTTGAAPTALCERFAAVVGVDPATVPPLAAPRNASMGRAETELVRLLNERLDYGLAWPVYGSRITHHLAVTALAGRPSSTALALPEGDRAWVCACSEAMIAELEGFGCTVTGDLGELRVAEHGRGAAIQSSRVEGPSLEELLDAALDAMVALIPVGPPPAPEPAPLEAVPEEAAAPKTVAPEAAAPDAHPPALTPRRPHDTGGAGRRRAQRLWRRIVSGRQLPVQHSPLQPSTV